MSTGKTDDLQARTIACRDPNDRSVLIFLTHNMVALEQLMAGLGLGVWNAIRDFQSAASTP